jgi:hypothetical protein
LGNFELTCSRDWMGAQVTVTSHYPLKRKGDENKLSLETPIQDDSQEFVVKGLVPTIVVLLLPDGEVLATKESVCEESRYRNFTDPVMWT